MTTATDVKVDLEGGVETVSSRVEVYNLSVEDALKEVDVDLQVGLTEEEAAARLELHGLNMLPAAKSKTLLQKIWEEVNSMIIYVLIAGALLSVGFEHYPDAIVIFSVVFINVTIGLLMEGKAEDTTKKLKKMMSPSALVLRGGEKVSVNTSDITVGDVFFLQPGDVVPADGRVITAFDLHVLEAPLTGESYAVNKNNAALLKTDVPLAERSCMVFSGTQIIKGSATCIAVHIGQHCEIGKISGLLKEVETLKTPLVLQLEHFGMQLSIGILVVACIALGVAIARGYSVGDSFSIAIGIAVAAIPEGLPSVVTISFAIGVRVMANKGAVVKALPAVETLGSVQVICSDKTGTLTMNQMTVTALASDEHIFEVANGVWSPPDRHLLQRIIPGIFCNDSTVTMGAANTQAGTSPAPTSAAGTAAAGKGTDASPDAETTDYHVISTDDLENGIAEQQAQAQAQAYQVQGDPTEACILSLACELAAPRQVRSWRRMPRVAEVPFDSSTKFMATMHTLSAAEAKELLLGYVATEPAGEQPSQETVTVIFVKGAPEKVLSFTPQPHLRWLKRAGNLAQKGMRVLGLAYKVVPADTVIEQEMTHAKGFKMVALTGIIDPPRPEAIVAVQNAQDAGITVKMITGDHPVTALAIGRVLGLHTHEDRGAVTGVELDAYANDQGAFDEIIISNDVFARTTPEHKLRIVQSLQRQGKVCSMTGDGVNDAPALKAANIGVAMGITGTEVAKDAANMIITDDNFATIVDAIRTGRTTYHNLVKILAFVLPTNGGQAFSIIVALIIGVEVPITALQILWVNMITSITLGIVLAFEGPHPDIMMLPPRKPGKAIFGRFLCWRVFFVSAIIVCGVLGVFRWENERISSVDELRTIASNTLAVCQVSYIFNCRNLRVNTGPAGILFGNKLLYVAIFVVACFQALFTYALPLQYVFHTRATDGVSWGKVILASSAVFILVETEKWIAATWNASRPVEPTPDIDPRRLLMRRPSNAERSGVIEYEQL